MSDERTLQLVSASVDGELDSQQQAHVERLLLDSSAAREFRSDLQRLDTLLSGLSELPVPGGLHARIMAGAKREVERAPRRTRQLSEFFLRYGLAAAVGVIVTMALYEWQPLDRIDYGEVAGTMAPGVRVLDRAVTRVDEVAAVVELQQSGGHLLLDIRLDAAETVEVLVDFAAAGLRPLNITQSSFPFESIEVAEQVLRARALGRQQVSVSLRRVENAAAADEAAIKLEYSSDGRVLKQGSLSSAIE